MLRPQMVNEVLLVLGRKPADVAGVELGFAVQVLEVVVEAALLLRPEGALGAVVERGIWVVLVVHVLLHRAQELARVPAVQALEKPRAALLVHFGPVGT